MNNICEAFNSAILEFRDKPIIQLFNDIRHYLMQRFINNKKKVLRYNGCLCPKIQDILEAIKVSSNKWTPNLVRDEKCSLFAFRENLTHMLSI